MGKLLPPHVTVAVERTVFLFRVFAGAWLLPVVAGDGIYLTTYGRGGICVPFRALGCRTDDHLPLFLLPIPACRP